MEPQNNLPQQESSPIRQESKSNNLLPIIASFLVTAILIGGGIFLWQQNSFKNQTSNLKTQLEQAKNENTTLENRLGSLEKIASETAAQKEEVEKKTCKGVWKNGVCVKSTCVDSDVNEKPKDIYIKGTVTYTDENGVETVVSDECTGSKKQVNEKWCYESPSGSGNYVQGKMVYNCPKGCLDGACVK